MLGIARKPIARFPLRSEICFLSLVTLPVRVMAMCEDLDMDDCYLDEIMFGD
jgi:hypothetical protein